MKDRDTWRDTWILVAVGITALVVVLAITYYAAARADPVTVPRGSEFRCYGGGVWGNVSCGYIKLGGIEE